MGKFYIKDKKKNKYLAYDVWLEKVWVVDHINEGNAFFVYYFWDNEKWIIKEMEEYNKSPEWNFEVFPKDETNTSHEEDELIRKCMKEELLQKCMEVRKVLPSGTTYTYDKHYDVLRITFDDAIHANIELLDFSEKFLELEQIYKDEVER